MNPRRPITKPAQGISNNNYDNKSGDLIIYVGDILGLNRRDKKRYRVMSLLGKGTFGQVVKCSVVGTAEEVAIKVIKNKLAYHKQGIFEIRVLKMLGNKFDDSSNIVSLIDTFLDRNHLCLVFELLDISLYDLLKQNGLHGVSTNLVRAFVQQIIVNLKALEMIGLIHCDLKPENILLRDQRTPAIKVIDFGSACFENHTPFTYIQSRFYRAPEVILGYPYTRAIDMWSLGCVAAELFLGLPLFPGHNEHNQLARIQEMMGDMPQYILEKGKSASKFYNVAFKDNRIEYTLKSEEEWAREQQKEAKPMKRWFNFKKLNEIVNYPLKKNLPLAEVAKKKNQREAFVDFLNGLLQLDPAKRWTASQASGHPFITGDEFLRPYDPPPPEMQRAYAFPGPSPPSSPRGSSSLWIPAPHHKHGYIPVTYGVSPPTTYMGGTSYYPQPPQVILQPPIPQQQQQVPHQQMYYPPVYPPWGPPYSNSVGNARPRSWSHAPDYHLVLRHNRGAYRAPTLLPNSGYNKSILQQQPQAQAIQAKQQKQQSYSNTNANTKASTDRQKRTRSKSYGNQAKNPAHRAPATKCSPRNNRGGRYTKKLFRRTRQTNRKGKQSSYPQTARQHYKGSGANNSASKGTPPASRHAGHRRSRSIEVIQQQACLKKHVNISSSYGSCASIQATAPNTSKQHDWRKRKKSSGGGGYSSKSGYTRSNNDQDDDELLDDCMYYSNQDEKKNGKSKQPKKDSSVRELTDRNKPSSASQKKTEQRAFARKSKPMDIRRNPRRQGNTRRNQPRPSWTDQGSSNIQNFGAAVHASPNHERDFVFGFSPRTSQLDSSPSHLDDTFCVGKSYDP